MRRLALLLAAVLLALPAVDALAVDPPVSTLLGDLVLDRASCVQGLPVGSWLAMTIGSQEVPNSTPNCGRGAVTLLQPGTGGLASGSFTPDPNPVFDQRGDSRAGVVVAPVLFDGHLLGLASSAQDVQDAPYGPPMFPVPWAYTQGLTLVMDLRALHLTYKGNPGTTCRSAQGHGCWLIGSQSARGTFHPSTSAFTLDWSAGQGFAGPSTAVTFHLSGHLVGHPTALPAGAEWALGSGRVDRVPASPTAVRAPVGPGTHSAVTLSPAQVTHRDRLLVALEVVAAALVVLLLLALGSTGADPGHTLD